MTTAPLQAPFPYFGGKRKAAETVWPAFGRVDNYVEPFAGSAAMLLAAPPDATRIETINDFDGFVANFWRALAHDPDAVAHAADWPVNEVDLMARHSWLVRHRQPITEQLCADPDWYDARSAGWWVWGACNWIGSGVPQRISRLVARLTYQTSAVKGDLPPKGMPISVRSTGRFSVESVCRPAPNGPS